MAEAASQSSGLPLIRAVGNRLESEAARPWRGMGFNNYYLAIDNTSTAVIDEILASARRLGLNLIRTWAFHDGVGKPTALQGPAMGQFIEERFALLDYALDRMARSGIRAILPLTNYWDAYGGMQQYVDWCGGGAKEWFYTHPGVREGFRGYLRFLTRRINTINGRRYAEDGAILAWQLANEPRCRLGPSVLTRWIAETSAFLKHELAVRQLVATGMEGFYAAGNSSHGGNRGMNAEGTDFIAQHDLPDIDIAGFHIYPDWWKMNSAQVSRWVTQHIRDAKAMLNKPVMLDEYGLRVPPNALADRDRLYRAVLELCEAEGCDASCFWMLYETGHPDFDQFGVYYPRDAGTATIIREFSSRMRAYNGEPAIA